MADSQPTPHVEWRDIPGYEGIYKVSAEGHVWSVRRPHTRSRVFYLNGEVLTSSWIGGHLLTPSEDKDGYLHVALCRDGSAKTLRVHRLVLEAFIGPRPKGMECCHANDVPDDNRLENLRWDYPKMNVADRIKNRRKATLRGPRTHCKVGHELTPENSIWPTPKSMTPRCRECERARDRKRRPPRPPGR